MNLTAILAILLVVFGLAGAGYFYWSQKEFASLNQTIATKSVEAETYKKTNEGIIDQMNAIKTLLDGVNTTINKNATDAAKAKQASTKHDIGKLAADKPRMIESVINKASDDAFSELEGISRDATKH